MEGQAALIVLVMIGLIIAFIVVQTQSAPDQGTREFTGGDSRDKARRAAKVKHIIDGDTAIVAIGRQEITLRLGGIDCPESDQHWGNISRYGLIKLIGGRRIRFEQHGLDTYGRTLATVFVLNNNRRTWTNVNARMVTLGHAWVSRLLCQHLPDDRRTELFHLQRWAKTKRVGLWKHANPVPPWEWRRNKGGRSDFWETVKKSRL